MSFSETSEQQQPAVPSNSFRRGIAPSCIHLQNALNVWLAFGKSRHVLKCVYQAAKPYEHLSGYSTLLLLSWLTLLFPGTLERKVDSLTTQLFVDTVTGEYPSYCNDEEEPCKTFFFHPKPFCRSRHDKVKQISAISSALVFLSHNTKHCL